MQYIMYNVYILLYIMFIYDICNVYVHLHIFVCVHTHLTWLDHMYDLRSNQVKELFHCYYRYFCVSKNINLLALVIINRHLVVMLLKQILKFY